ncbi:MAG TPA: CBS domain-containing protein [Myxococcota bacterium]|nr:CBS domain-containing protein [Myxococcota bacterium]
MLVRELMKKDVESCLASAPLCDAARIMWDRDCGCVPVVESREDPRVVGIVTDRDALMAAYTRGTRVSELSVGDVMSRNVKTCKPEDSLASAAATMTGAQVRRLPVVDAAGQLLGMLSLADVAREFARRRSGKGAVSASEVSELLAGICAPHSPLVAASA